MASFLPGEWDWMDRDPARRGRGGFGTPGRAGGGLLGGINRAAGLLNGGLIAPLQRGIFGFSDSDLLDERRQAMERMREVEDLRMEQLRAQMRDADAKRAEQGAVGSALRLNSLRMPAPQNPDDSQLTGVNLPRLPSLPQQYAGAAGSLARQGYGGSSVELAEQARQMMPKPLRPQYVAPGGVLLDPDTNEELYRNELPERARGNDAPSGYRWKPDGNMEPVPGGPADPSVTNTRKGTQPLRKEFRGLQSVKDYETSLPLLVSARNAPDDGYGDLQLIYTAGKILDPGSVVREGELALTVAAGSPLQRILGTTRFTAEQGGRLTPQTRQQLLGMLNERVLAYRQAYDRDYNQYKQYAGESSIDPSQVVGSHAASAYAKSKPPAPRQQQAPAAAIAHLRANPQLREAFRQKYGYLPDGL